jgi:hypothetical protein
VLHDAEKIFPSLFPVYFAGLFGGTNTGAAHALFVKEQIRF